jgi:MerR family transcriptional regulator, redox-sensitive transcriptional activator SoxR
MELTSRPVELDRYRLIVKVLFKSSRSSTMPGMLIGEIARRTGLRPSTIRFYEKAALIAPPGRLSKQRRYGLDAVGRLELIKLALRSGFSIAETRDFISGFTGQTPPAARWRAFAERKLVELKAERARIETMEGLLEASFRCDCPSLEVCERFLAAGPKCGS